MKLAGSGKIYKASNKNIQSNNHEQNNYHIDVNIKGVVGKKREGIIKKYLC